MFSLNLNSDNIKDKGDNFRTLKHVWKLHVHAYTHANISISVN